MYSAKMFARAALSALAAATITLLGAARATPAPNQAETQGFTQAPPLSFDVATIRPVDPQSPGMRVTGTKVYPGGRVVIQDLPLKALVQIAFNTWQISGGEDWTSKVNFDVVAKPPEGMQPPFKLGYTWYTIEDERLRQMLQALLIGRFQLKVHIETKTGTVYAMEKTGKPLRLTPTKLPDNVAPAAEGFCSIGRAAATWVIQNCTFQKIAYFAGNYVIRHPVLDKTGLDGHFDFRYQILQADPLAMPSDDSSFPDAVGAMGLKLRQTTGPVETLVIDRAEMPSPN